MRVLYVKKKKLWIADGCLYVTDFILEAFVLLYAISSHLAFNMNKTILPASFIRGVWRLSKNPTRAGQKWYVADQGFTALFAKPIQSP